MCCYLDSLAGYRYGGKSCQKRFGDFLIEYSSEAAVWSKISLPLLKRHLEEKNERHYDDFIHFLRKLGVITSNYLNLNYNVDITLEDLETQAKDNVGMPCFQKLHTDVLRYQYTAILWREYRNLAVHETSTKPDKAQNLAKKTEPYYSNVSLFKDGKIVEPKTRFDIPQVFILRALKSCLARLAVDRKFDPGIS